MKLFNFTWLVVILALTLAILLTLFKVYVVSPQTMEFYGTPNAPIDMVQEYSQKKGEYIETQIKNIENELCSLSKDSRPIYCN